MPENKLMFNFLTDFMTFIDQQKIFEVHEIDAGIIRKFLNQRKRKSHANKTKKKDGQEDRPIDPPKKRRPFRGKIWTENNWE